MRLPITLLLGLCACAPGYEEDTLDGLRRVSATLDVKRKGLVDFKLDVSAAENGLLVTAEAADGFRTHVRRMYAPKNEERFDAITEAEGVFSSTNAGYLSSVATLNWPRNGVEQLEEGRWRVEFGNVSDDDRYRGGTLSAVAFFKEDADLSSGHLRVNIVFAGDARQDAELHQAVDEALVQWTALYATVGLTLDITQSEWDNADLAAPVFGIEEDYIRIADASDPFTVSVVLVPELADFDDVFGVAGDIPGPLSATTRSAVLIAADLSAGADGVFNAQETRILGETMAHEVGHYVGLYHPVETEWDHWDALDDTDECPGQNRCISAMADHLMFPFPVCGLSTCQSQVVITGDQMGVMQAYVGVD